MTRPTCSVKVLYKFGTLHSMRIRASLHCIECCYSGSVVTSDVCCDREIDRSIISQSFNQSIVDLYSA